MSSITVCVPWMLHLLGTLLSYHLFHVFCSLERLEDEFYNCVRAMDVASFGDIIELSFISCFLQPLATRG